MLMAFLTALKQVLTLFFLMLVGFILGKAKLIEKTGSKNMSSLVMYVVTPCMLIVAFQRELVLSDLRNFGLTILVSLVLHAAGIALSYLCLRDRDPSRRGLLQFASVFSNCGFMGYPMMTAMVGTIGVFFGSAYVVVFTILGWTWGIFAITGEKSRLSIRPILLNPGVISVVLALGLYLLRITLPELLMTPITYLSSLNTPLPMVVVGYQLSHADFGAALKNVNAWITLVLRMILSPALAIVLCLMLKLDYTVSIVLVIAAAAPPAALLNMLSAKFDADTELASSVVSVHTVLSVVTMPVMVGLAQYLLG